MYLFYTRYGIPFPNGSDHAGISDVAGKYYAPQFGSFIIYIIMIVVLIWRPQGLFSRAIAK